MNDTVIIFCFFIYVQGSAVGRHSLVPYSEQTWRVLFSQHISETDFASSECISLKRIVVSQSEVSAAVRVCDVKMFSVACQWFHCQALA
jgi:hypothetical protein